MIKAGRPFLKVTSKATTHATQFIVRREAPHEQEHDDGLRMTLLTDLVWEQGCIYFGDGVDTESDAGLSD